MTKIKIITDSTADIPKEIAEKLKIEVVPLNVTIDGETYLDGIDFTPEEFIQKMRESKELPKSSQPSVGAYAEVYEKLKGDDVEILCLTVSEKLSGTYQSATMAKEIADANVTVFSSDFISGPLQAMVYEAVEMAEKNFAMDDIIARLSEMRDRFKLLVAVDTLDNLVKGGRIGKGAAVIGSFLNIKPILTIQDGLIVPIEKLRSTNQVMKYFIKNLTEDMNGKQIKSLSIIQVHAKESAEMLLAELKKVTSIESIPVINATPVIATHAGEGTIAISYLVE